MDDLKPCPFCGGANLLTTETRGHLEAYVECQDCGASGPDGLPDDQLSAIAAWNTRAKPKGKIK